ncbi:MAG TPA: tetratricopeptide repeat protein, partial [Thermoanaerobaculia bacterium]|nr:tetratricopeptide repeat protein [Thermoanaerobaculia bacterium]
DPWNLRPPLALAQLFLDRNRPDAALAQAEAALQLAPRDWRALGRRGEALLALRRFQEAAESFDRVIELRPRLPYPRYLLARALTSLDRSDEAKAELRKSLDLDPGFTPASRLLSELEQG